MESLPDIWLPRPEGATASSRERFEALWEHALSRGPADPVPYRLAEPKWQFLCHIADHADVVLHGSQDPAIELFEPRKADDVIEFGDRAAVYAATDGVWPMYYAILDRARNPMSLTNACIRIQGPSGEWSEPYYYFSITDAALVRRPWRTGTVYVLPGETFTVQPPMAGALGTVQPAQAASAVPVRPLAKVTVHPQDFPFLHQIRGHDDRVLQERATKDPNGFPWLTDP